jgi:CheY-like chemotaxis protein
MSGALAGKKILVVDDDEKILGIVSLFLREAGYEVHSTHDPLQALRLASEVHPALAILDVSMPRLNGFDLAAQIASDPDTADLPFMFLSAASTERNIEDARDVHARAYLEKPFRKDALLKTIRDILDDEDERQP